MRIFSPKTKISEIRQINTARIDCLRNSNCISNIKHTVVNIVVKILLATMVCEEVATVLEVDQYSTLETNTNDEL